MDLELRRTVAGQDALVNKFYEKFATNLDVCPNLLRTFIESKDLNDRELNYLNDEHTDRRKKVHKLLNIVQRKHLVPVFYEALLRSGQWNLAEILNSEICFEKLDPPKAKNSSGQTPSLQNGDHHSHGRSVIIHQFSEEALKRNCKFYEAEIKYIPYVEETCGVIENLAVDAVDLPINGIIYNSNDTYRNFTTPKGLALIINNRDFQRNGGLPDRLGTDVDCANINNLLTALGYRVKIKENLSALNILLTMQKFGQKREHKVCDSTVVVVLSHGKNGKIYGVDCAEIEIHSIVACLNSNGCPDLIDKPKIFIVQACRGEKYDMGVGRDFIDGSDETCSSKDRDKNGKLVDNLASKIVQLDLADAQVIFKTPIEADILIAYATTPGYVSWRNSVHGSWFVQAVCQVFCKKAKTEEILHLFTEVNNIVAKKVSSSQHVQIPEPCSRLRKKFFFFPGVDVNRVRLQ